MTTFAELTLSADTTGMVAAENSLNRVTQASTRTETATKRTKASSDALSQSQGRLAAANTAATASTSALNRALQSNGLRNFGLQMNQVAQQTAAGGGALRALSIQMPDLLLGFGTLGILAGVAAPALMSVAGAFFASSNAASELTASLLDSNAGLGSVRGMVSELKNIQDSYTQAIAASANTSTSAAATIAANSEREFNARRQVLQVELQLLRVRAQEQAANLRVLQEEARSQASAAVGFTRDTTDQSDYTGGFAYTGPRTMAEVLGPSFDASGSAQRRLAIQRLNAEIELTQLAADEASTALDTVFNGGVGGGEVTAEIETGGAAGAGARAAGSAAAESAEAFYGLSEAQKAALSEIQSMSSPTQDYGAKMADLNHLLDIGAISQADYQAATQELNDELASSIPLVDDVASAFGDWVASGFQDFKGMVDSIWQSFQQLLSDMIAAAARNQIMFAMGFGGGSPAAGGIGSSLLGSFGGGGGLAGLAGGSGLMGGLGNALGGGLGNVFNIGANAAAAGGGAMATIGAALPVVGALGLAVAAFTTKTKELDAGIRITAKGASLAAEEFRVLEKSRFFGLSKSTSTESGTSGMQGALREAYRGIYSGVTETAATLGIGAKAFKGFSAKIKISTKDMTAEEAQAAVMEKLAETQDKLAKRALVSLKGAANLIKEGETATQALGRVSEAMSVTTGVFERLGGSAFDFTAKGAAAASKLVEMAGGAQQFAQNASNFVEGFYSTEEKLALAKKDFRQAIGEIGLGMVPQTKEQFRELVDRLIGQGKNRKAGQLMALSDEFLQIRGFKQELREVEKAAKESAKELKQLAREKERERRQRRADRAAAVDEAQFGTYAEFRAAQIIAGQPGGGFSGRGGDQKNIQELLAKMVDYLAATNRNTSDLVAYQFQVN